MSESSLSDLRRSLRRELRRVQLLNGWWDFQPVAHPDLSQPLEPERVPRRGWKKACYLVPGFFTDHPYPEEWRTSRSGWMRTAFSVDDVRLTGQSSLDSMRSDIAQRAYMLVKAAIPKAFIFVNGKLVAAQEDMFIGDEHDVTDLLQPGQNELAVFLTEFDTFPHPDTGQLCLIDVPWGCCSAQEQAGIWQDVQLEWRAAVHIADITIRTSTREHTLTVIAAVHNAGAQVFHGVLCHDVAGVALNFPPIEVDLQPGETRTYTHTAPWMDYTSWCPERPHLYWLHSAVFPAGEEEPCDALHTRFGFREVWIEGHRLMLNGRPQRWYGEWCHKAHSHWLRPEYVRQWYRQLKDLNMNYVRMHTFPHPDYFLDIADEMGVLVCQESALHGSGQAGWETPDLWPRAEAHVRRMVRRDKNHPSLVLYSVENEMRWSLSIVPGAKDKLPGLRALFNHLDPTRPAYHEGDTSLWNEGELNILSRHYGPACHGMGWWDKRAPLHAGEMGRWHYASPYHALQWAGDEVFAEYKHLSQSIARDACRIIELARANEVSSVFPWNTSGLDNFRPAEARTFEWDPNTRYAKPLAHKPYESEYAWWQPNSGYRPGFSFDMLKRAFRPLAVVIREERNQFYTDRPIAHTVYVVNDLPDKASGTLEVRLEHNGVIAWREVFSAEVAAGCTQTISTAPNPAGLPAGQAEIITILRTNQGRDMVRRPVRLADPSQRWELIDLPSIAVVGQTAALRWLADHGGRAVRVLDIAALDVQCTPIAVIGERTIAPGSTQNQHLREFVQAGGRVLVLEQDHSVFPGLSLARMPIEMARVRDPLHPVLHGIDDDDLRFFGDDPFGLPSSNAWVTVLPYLKPRDEHLVRILVDSSGGDFGSGGLQWAPVIEAQIGRGVIVASQLRLADKLDALPVADRFLRNALAYLAAFQPPETYAAPMPAIHESVRPEALSPGRIIFLSGAQQPDIDPETMAARLAEGGTALVWELNEAGAQYWERVLGRHIELFAPEHPVYHLIARRENGPSPLLGGISNEDTCWLENWTYTRNNYKEPIVDQLIRIDGGIVHLCNASEAGLDILFGDDHATEWKRMPALSRFFDGPRPQIGAGLVEVSLGAGRVIFCQLRWRPALWQFRRFLGLLLWNLGERTATDVLAGECTPSVGRQSAGYPTHLRMARVSEHELAEILSLAKRRAESYAVNMPFREWRGWHTVEGAEGRFSAPAGDGMVAIGLEVVCPEPRKFMQTIGGLPNPDLQTFLRLHGAGHMRAWVNGVLWGDLALVPDRATYVTDIDFEAGSNFIVLTWEPEGDNPAVSLCFENKDRRPETTFAFV
ncbi:MAG: glycoside hydrolase family 2 TIM barrel-domain containing protein [Anaerolineae bacterium]|nr:hypothetical protein [Thermoflexales bacterium]MDW8407502.1 glycoside hydrolase family 2 TIM barrel-domain containing protein [Anaerolineae bacterium]